MNRMQRRRILSVSVLSGVLCMPDAFVPLQQRPVFVRPLKSSNVDVPTYIESPVLQQVYPALLRHQEEHGNPNIPLGTAEGRQCQTLRRLQMQQKLSEEEVSLLTKMGFRFHSLEDVYHEVDFDEMIERLLSYKKEFAGEGFQIPKKFPPDPELGAWVMGLRRLGPAQVKAEHAEKLEGINFAWKSNRKCGSAFMKQYREYRERAQTEGEDILQSDRSIVAWVQAQKEADRRGNLSATRDHYMIQLFGEDWKR